MHTHVTSAPPAASTTGRNGRRRTRRIFDSVLGIATAAVLLAGCGQSSTATTSTSTSAAPVTSTGGASAAAVEVVATPVENGAYPATVEHEFGSTTISAEPQRVVTIGATDQDTVIALGVTPVAIDALWPYDTGIGPWSQAVLTGDQPAVLETLESGEINFELVAAQRPDLILAVQSGVDDTAFATLSKIAPTVARPKGSNTYGATLEQETLTVGQALGRPAAAQALLDSYDAQLAATVAAHPEWQGKTVVAGTLLDDGGFGALTVTSPEMSFLTSLGLTAAPVVAKATTTDWAVTISKENIGDLDADVILFMDYSATTEATVAVDPLWQKVPAIEAGRVLYLQAGDQINQLGRQTVLANSFGLQNFPPLLSPLLS